MSNWEREVIADYVYMLYMYVCMLVWRPAVKSSDKRAEKSQVKGNENCNQAFVSNVSNEV